MMNLDFGSGAVMIQAATPSMNVWRSVTYDPELRTPMISVNRLKKVGCIPNSPGIELITKMPMYMGAHALRLNLVVVHVNELLDALGCSDDGIYLGELFNLMHNLGLVLCPADLGPQLRLDYNDQPNDEWLHIAAAPIPLMIGPAFVFSIGRGGIAGSDEPGIMQLYGCRADPGSFWFRKSKWVFALPYNVEMN